LGDISDFDDDTLRLDYGASLHQSLYPDIDFILGIFKGEPLLSAFDSLGSLLLYHFVIRPAHFFTQVQLWNLGFGEVP
jgi:hypothetical protein